MVLLFCVLLSMLWTRIYFLLFLSLFSCSVLHQSHDLESEIINNHFHKGSASKRYGILIIKWDSDFYVQVKLAVIKGFLYFCLSSLGMSKMFKKHNGKKWHKVNRKGKLWLNLGDPWSGVSSASPPFCASWTGRGTAQHCGTATALHEVTSREFQLSCCLFFPCSWSY